MDMRSIVSSFTRDTGFNDVLVHGFVCVQQKMKRGLSSSLKTADTAHES